MRHYFYELVTWITNMITGLDNNNLRLDTVGTWIKTSNEVTIWLNILCLLVTTLLISIVIDAGIGMYEKHKKLHSVEDEKGL